MIFPSKGQIPLSSKITGSDLDGDIYWVCWEQSFVKEFKKRDYSYKLTILKNEEKLEDEYTYDEKGEKIRKVCTNINTKDFNKSKYIINSSIKNDIGKALKNNENMDDINQEIKRLCLKYYIFYQNHYKLPEVSKNHLALINELFKNDAYKDGSLNEELEKHAFYHSIEVDFQKTGETSFFSSKKSVPTFLKKKEQYKLSNNIIKLKEIYDEYKNIYKDNFISEKKIFLEESEDNSSTLGTQSFDNNNMNEKNSNFYEFFISRGRYQEIDMNRKNMKLFDKRKLISDKKNLFFIYQLYELISFYPPMQNSFLTSIYLMTEDFFYENIYNKKVFTFSQNLLDNKSLFFEIIKKIKDINTKYENEIKYIMKENCITIEIELIFFNEFIDPKKEVHKHDVEDYRKNLFESVNLIKNNSIKGLEIIRNEYLLNNEDIQHILFIILFWVPKEDVSINNNNGENNKINLNHILDANKNNKSVKCFIEDLVMKNNFFEMNNFFYDNMKCISLYFFYCIFSENSND